MVVRFTLCDLGAPGWGQPWFPLRFLLLHSHVFVWRRFGHSTVPAWDLAKLKGDRRKEHVQKGSFLAPEIGIALETR